MAKPDKSGFVSIGCLAALVLFGGASTSQAEWLAIHNDFQRYDTEGNPIRTRSGTLRKFGDTYYWYGSASGFRNQTCYASKDLLHWTNKGIVIEAPSTNRMDVIYNDANKQYVMFLKTGRSDGCSLGVATSPTPDGKFTLKGNSLVHGSKIGDLSVWQDDDNQAYLAYVWDSIPGANSGGISQHAFAVLSADYLTVGKRMWLWNRGSREAPMMMKRRGLYYYLTSLTLWTESTATQYYTASSLAGPWSNQLIPMQTPGNTKNNSWDTQCDFVFPFKGSQDTVQMFAGDRWEKPDPLRLGDYAWLPMSFTSKDSVVVNYHQDWEVNPVTGTWRPLDPARNLALGKTATASSSAGANAAGNATDASTWQTYANTKWVSSALDSQWIRIDLGSPKSLNRVILKWDSAYAKAFKIQVSADTVAWSDVFETDKAGQRAVTDELFAATTARYVRMLCTQRGTTGGVSLYDFMVLYDEGATVSLPRPAGRKAATAATLAFRDRTVRYTLAAAGPVRLEVLDSRGKVKSILADGYHAAGEHAAVLPRTFSSGAYVLRMASGDKTLKTVKIEF